MVMSYGWPAAESAVESRRWAEVSRRRKILSGDWKDLLTDAARRRLGRRRLRGLGELEESQNALEFLCRELAVLYEYEPTISNRQPGDIATLRTELRLMNLWGTLGEVQYNVLGLRNMLVRVDVEGEGDEARASVRAVFPDQCHVDSTIAQPGQPVAVREWRQRTIEGVTDWYLDDLSIADPAEPFYRVFRRGTEGGAHVDVTEAVLGKTYNGQDYPYRDASGKAILPYVAYHARNPAAGFWRSFELKEVVSGTLTLAIMDALGVSAYCDASWPQRWVANARVVGSADSGDGGEREEVVTDPSSLLMFEAEESEDGLKGQIMVGQFAAGADPEKLARTVEMRKASLVTSFGVPPGDLVRTSGDGGTSGVALALNNEGKRAAQRRSANVHRDSDQRLIRTIACMLNTFRGTSAYAEWGYSIDYTELPLSPQERMARQMEIDFQMERGLMSQVQAYMLLHPGVTVEDAQAAIKAVASEANNGARAPTGGSNG